MSSKTIGRSENESHAIGEPKLVKKMSLYGVAWRGTCSCGWTAHGCGSRQKANKDAQQHVTAKNAADKVQEARRG